MALVGMSPPGQRQAKGGALENTATVMNALGSLGDLYGQFKKPVTIESFDQQALMNELAKRNLAETTRQGSTAVDLGQKRLEYGGPAGSKFSTQNRGMAAISRKT